MGLTESAKVASPGHGVLADGSAICNQANVVAGVRAALIALALLTLLVVVAVL